MKKGFLLFVLLVVTFVSNAQSKGVKIGYIDMDYILEKVPDYKESSVLLEQKAQKWKQDIEVKKNDITKLKELLKTERALLTKELIGEREEEIKFLENDLLDYQQKRFGPNGDLIIQKASIIKPIQDQVFNAVQDIAEAKNYDFIFDKSSDLTMLFSAKRYDVSDQVVRTITRAEKREEMSKKQLKALEEKEAKEDEKDVNPELAEKEKNLGNKRAERQRILDERKQAANIKRKEFEENRKKLLAVKKNGTKIDSTAGKSELSNNVKIIDKQKATQDSLKTVKENARLQTIENNKKALEDRKKALEEKKKKVLEEREAARKAREEKLKK
jgi:Skp family chaperone for outer membrane proteins